MNQPTLNETLGLQPDTVLQLTHLDAEVWGQTLRFTGHAGEMCFCLTLTDCRESRWQLYAHMNAADCPAFPPATIVDLHVGKDQHRQPLQLLTDYFGLTVSYGGLLIERADDDRK